MQVRNSFDPGSHVSDAERKVFRRREGGLAMQRGRSFEAGEIFYWTKVRVVCLHASRHEVPSLGRFDSSGPSDTYCMSLVEPGPCFLGSHYWLLSSMG